MPAPSTPEATPTTPRSFQEIILRLQAYWAEQGCAIMQPYDMEVGAGTFHPATTLRSLGTKPWAAAYVQPSRRPTDGRYGENPNRLQHYYQYQVLIKPSPPDLQDLYLGSLRPSGSIMDMHDIRFVEDDWESPTLGAWGLGWEVWCDGMEVSQFTYFQQVGGHDCHPGLGRADLRAGAAGDVCPRHRPRDGHALQRPGRADRAELRRCLPPDRGRILAPQLRPRGDRDAPAPFRGCGGRVPAILGPATTTPRPASASFMAHPAYDQCIKASHIFNLLDARGVISVTERQAYIGRVRALAKLCADAFLASDAGGWTPGDAA
jgi:glycyl-tRNA synthetase alpha chain